MSHHWWTLSSGLESIICQNLNRYTTDNDPLFRLGDCPSRLFFFFFFCGLRAVLPGGWPVATGLFRRAAQRSDIHVGPCFCVVYHHSGGRVSGRVVVWAILSVLSL